MTRFWHDLPLVEYGIPLVIGMVVGVCAIVAGRLVIGRKPSSSARTGESTPVQCTSRTDPFIQGSSSEKRKANRRGGNPIEIFVARPGHKDSPTYGWVVDRSLGGLSLNLGEAINPGTLLAVLPVKAPQTMPWIDIEVRTCRPTSEGWEVGCQFVKTPPYAVLLMFG
jgi:hypothetical protein